MIANLKIAWKLITRTFDEWTLDNCPRLGAAVSFYTLFSLAPVLIIAIAIAGMVFGESAARGEIVAQLQALVGSDGAAAIQSLLKNAQKPEEGILAASFGILTLFIGATGVFVELQSSLNTVWNVAPRPGRGIKGVLRDRLISFGLVLGVGFLLLVSLVITASIEALNNYMDVIVPSGTVLWQGLNMVVSFVVVTLLFGMIYKFLPDVDLEWGDVLRGATITAILFTIGKYLIGLYLGNSSIASSYGAAGSLVILLSWVYYSAQIMLFGAEFTQVWAEYRGHRICPADNAIVLPRGFYEEVKKKAADKQNNGMSAAQAVGEAIREETPKAEREAERREGDAGTKATRGS